MNTKLRKGMAVGCVVLGAYLALATIVYLRQRSMLYFPTHTTQASGLNPWEVNGVTVGFCREAKDPSSVWLMAHGNAGQAAHRDYLLSLLGPDASLYVVEYPGYGHRPGTPSKESMDRAVADAYLHLVEMYPGHGVRAIGESIGSGPVCELARLANPPARIVLLVPFDSLVSVAAEHMPFLPVRLLLRDRWDNVSALASYQGPVEIYGAQDDVVIPVSHARDLASAVGARFILLSGGHNDWDASALRLE